MKVKLIGILSSERVRMQACRKWVFLSNVIATPTSLQAIFDSAKYRVGQIIKKLFRKGLASFYSYPE
jgi:hypothetical protein